MTKVMVVDDEPDLREMVGILISKEGFETDLAKDGSDFLEKIDSFNPDIVTLDVMMPGLTTSEILKKLKEKKSSPKIILLTVVRYSAEEKKKIFEVGNIVDYVTKPFELDDFMDTVKKLIFQKLNFRFGQFT